MLLVCDIGNSNIVFGLYDDDELAAHWRITSRLNATVDESNNCIHADPMFVGGGDYRLQSGSPCIDAGANSYIDSLGVTTDLDGNPGKQGGTVDIGPYEKQ